MPEGTARVLALTCAGVLSQVGMTFLIVGLSFGKTPPPAKRGRRLRLYYAAQVGESPPRIAIQVNDRKLISRDWAYHLENRMRETYELDGVPLVIDFVPRTGYRGRED